MNAPCWTPCLMAIGWASLAAGVSPEDEVVAAATRFLAQPNYSWGASTTTGSLESQSFVFSEAIEGKHETGGYTKAWFLIGPHIPRKEWPASEPWPGITDDDAHYSKRWAFLTPDGWKAMNKLPSLIDPLDQIAGALGTRTDVSEIRHGEMGNSAPVTVLDAQIGNSVHMLRYGWFGFWRPDQEITVIVEHLASVNEAAPGFYDAELTPEGVELLANSPPPAVARALGIPWRIGDAKVSVTLNLEHGILTGYQLAVSGTWTFTGQREPVRCRRSRSLTDVGTTTIEVPDGLTEMLDH